MNNNGNPQDHHLEYYIKLAISTARNISRVVRQSNGQQIEPKKGDDLQPISVFEPMTASFLTKTQEVCETQLVCVHSNSEFVNGYWRRYVVGERSFSKITIPLHNYCWARYIVCKELMHNYLHDTGSTTDQSAELRDLILKLMRGWVDEKDEAPLIAEIAAYYGAIEYLMPLDVMPLVRAIFRKVFDETQDESKAYSTIAHLLRIPLSLVEYRLSNTRYFED